MSVIDISICLVCWAKSPHPVPAHPLSKVHFRHVRVSPSASPPRPRHFHQRGHISLITVCSADLLPSLFCPHSTEQPGAFSSPCNACLLKAPQWLHGRLDTALTGTAQSRMFPSCSELGLHWPFFSSLSVLRNLMNNLGR